jgi:hypothetical protein
MRDLHVSLLARVVLALSAYPSTFSMDAYVPPICRQTYMKQRFTSHKPGDGVKLMSDKLNVGLYAAEAVGFSRN